ncbi:hypothetical protein GCM10009763_21570 [Dermacoccus profundi]|uniref:Uncharacterized protein n=1 Tax=Dermacoccus profundi TaxID=322602 RepID=A0ABP4P561_9MICO
MGTLTTIDQRGQEKGRTIADMVTSALARTRENREHSFTLVQGTSTDPPRPTPTRDICLTLPPLRNAAKAPVGDGGLSATHFSS